MLYDTSFAKVVTDADGRDHIAALIAPAFPDR